MPAPPTFPAAAAAVLVLLGDAVLERTPQLALLHGVTPSSRNLYAGATDGGRFRCLDGLREVLGSEVNDDYCDCADGSDEPGTAACAGIAGATFHCGNVRFRPKLLPVSRVRDGICDCCDGSDEEISGHGAISGNFCENICEAEGESERATLEQQVASAERGLQVRETLEAAMVNTVKQWQDELNLLEIELANLEKERKETRERLNTFGNATEEQQPEGKRVTQPSSADPSEHVIFEEHFETPGVAKRWRITEKGGATIHKDRERGKVLVMNSCTWGGMVFSKASFACSVGSECKISFWAKGAPWQGFSRSTKKTTEQPVDAHSWLAVPSTSADFPDRLTATTAASDWSFYEYEFPSRDEFQMFGSGDVRFSTSPTHIMLQAHSSTGFCASTMFDDFRIVTWGPTGEQHDSGASADAKEKNNNAQVVSEYAQWALGTGSMPPPSSAHTSSEMEEATSGSEVSALQLLERRLRAAKSRNISLVERLQHISGEHAFRWAPLVDKCVMGSFDQYNYTICFFSNATQGSTNLGSFDGWDEGTQAQQPVMRFSHGHRCHAGPARSLRAELVCGAAHEVLDLSEPSRCSYWARVATPCACSQEGLKQLEEEVQAVSRSLAGERAEL
eukprot:TRINITY_DN15977_c0_g1_i1.p1 TRINITY_DN15977_c0_g1~~TRINITY_DN15977_c0_g1_i1.p1  ORF type:complete len:620 (+),score=123.16 TRINITY_DN15977_c0_g1_i1:42-1901(+)